jgi:hypothetical protein
MDTLEGCKAHLLALRVRGILDAAGTRFWTDRISDPSYRLCYANCPECHRPCLLIERKCIECAFGIRTGLAEETKFITSEGRQEP